jgi:hypothetical protein
LSTAGYPDPYRNMIPQHGGLGILEYDGLEGRGMPSPQGYAGGNSGVRANMMSGSYFGGGAGGGGGGGPRGAGGTGGNGTDANGGATPFPGHHGTDGVGGGGGGGGGAVGGGPGNQVGGHGGTGGPGRVVLVWLRRGIL